ncbi:hypothetical protein Leryth_000927 [Lithospermum erythrorhizon]|nr:hypothetical protein Leryth_000927 [Lithospermum erythrorhizon]
MMMKKETDDTMLVPTWLERLLNTSFFTICKTHGDASKSECNMYCLDCNNSDAFCFYCRSSKHKDHQVIQIRRSSYHDVVRVSEIQRGLDIGGIQTYVINSARVMFLNERPQPKSTGKGFPHLCEICGRSLLDPFRFCSLGCKLKGIKRGANARFCLDAKNEIGIIQRGDDEGMSSRRRVVLSSKEEDGKELREGSQQDIYPPTARRRKGIPHRAPFGT